MNKNTLGKSELKKNKNVSMTGAIPLIRDCDNPFVRDRFEVESGDEGGAISLR